MNISKKRSETMDELSLIIATVAMEDAELFRDRKNGDELTVSMKLIDFPRFVSYVRDDVKEKSSYTFRVSGNKVYFGLEENLFGKADLNKVENEYDCYLNFKKAYDKLEKSLDSYEEIKEEVDYLKDKLKNRLEVK